MKRSRTMALAAVVVGGLVAAACGGSATRQDAIDGLMSEIGFRQSQAECGADAVHAEFGTYDIQSATDEDGERLGAVLVECISTDFDGSDRVETTAGADEGSAQSNASADVSASSEVTPDETVVAEPVAGRWSALQLCSLLDASDIGDVFGASGPAVPKVGVENEDESSCYWEDPDSADAVPPEFMFVSQETIAFLVPTGEGSPLEIPGADAAQYLPAYLPDLDFIVLQANGDQLTLQYPAGVEGAADIATAAAERWAAIQAGL